MNIDPVFTNNSARLLKTSPSKPDLSKLDEASKDRLELLSVLSQNLLVPSAPKFATLISKLSQLPVDYVQCKLLFVQAYIQDFNADEKTYFLKHFFEHFDPKREIVQIDQLDMESKDFFWDRVIRYLCESYIDFPADARRLEETFKSPSLDEETLEEKFDNGMDLLLDFSASNKVECKVLFATYLAKLISQLEEYQVNSGSQELSRLNELFGEVYFYLLNLPSPHRQDHNTLLSLRQGDLELLDDTLLHNSFVENLMLHLKTHQNISEEKAQKIELILRDVDFGLQG